MGFSHDVFISYAHEDVAFVRLLARLLDRASLVVWLDEERMRGGEPVRERIEAAIAQSRHAIFVLTEAWQKKDWTGWEATRFRLAIKGERGPNERRMVPILRGASDPGKFGPSFNDSVAVPWRSEATDVDARFWLLYCALVEKATTERGPGPESTWATKGRKALGWPPLPAPIPENLDSPATEHQRLSRPTPSRCLEGPDPILLLDRDVQWGQLERIVRSPNSELALVLGDKRQAHDVFLRRARYCLPSDPPRDVRAVVWQPIPPATEADYGATLSLALGCGPDEVVDAVKAAVRDRNLVLVHTPVVQAMLQNEAFVRYYTHWLPGIVSQVDPSPRPDDRIGAIKAIQAVTWLKAGRVATGAARLLRRVGMKSRWIEDATEHQEALRLANRLRFEGARALTVSVLDELGDVTRDDVDRWARILPAGNEWSRILDAALRGCQDTASIFEAITAHLGGREERLT